MSPASGITLRARVSVALVVLAAPATGLLLSGCGDTGSATGAVHTAAGQTSDVIVKSDDTVSKSEFAEPDTAVFPTGHDTDEENASGRKLIKPCTLVSVRQAEAILGPHVRRSEHPQGPTCIFAGSGREITLTLQEVSLRQLREDARKATAVNVGGQPGWCLRYEKTSVAVAIHPREVLVVGGPCQAGVPFAADALANL